MSGGKGGSSTSSVQIPEYIEKAAQQNLNKAEKISQIGFVPQYGPSVAAFTPTQNAAFDNIANSASAFGMATPGAGTSANYGGMGQPTDFGGGVMGYSAKPLYNNMVNQFAADRPGQYNYINSFFIDPYTGQAGSNVTSTNYNDYSTATDMAEAQMANELAIAQANAGPQNVTNLNLTQNELDNYENIIGGSTYNSQTDVLTPEQQTQIINYQAPALDGDVNTNEYANDPGIAQDTVNMAILGNANNDITDAFTQLTGNEPSFDDPSSAGSYGGSLVTGELSTDLTGVPGLAGEIIDNVYSSVNFEGAVADQGENFAEAAGSTQLADGTYDISDWFTDTSDSPTIDTSGFETQTPTEGIPGPTYDGSSEKNAAVAAILKDTYGWSDQQLIDGGYEGYAPNGEGVGTANVPDPDPMTQPSDDTFIPNFNAASNDAAVNPTGQTVGNDDFANSVLASDDASDFLAPVVNNDDGGTIGQISPGGQDAGEGFEWVDNGGYLTRTWVGTDDDDDTTTTTTNTSSNNSSSNNDDDDSGGGGGGGGCVVATHAVNSGAFTPSMKREAVVWCMHNLHDKWWGEAIRRGYRHLGRKKIEQGKAHEHYQEFRNYIDFASGKKRTLKGALHFAARSAQFFVVGLFKGDA